MYLCYSWCPRPIGNSLHPQTPCVESIQSETGSPTPRQVCLDWIHRFSPPSAGFVVEPDFCNCFRVKVCPPLDSFDRISISGVLRLGQTDWVKTDWVATRIFKNLHRPLTVRFPSILQRVFSTGTSDHGFPGLSVMSSVSPG